MAIKLRKIVMAEKTISQIFGSGATRLANGATTSSAGLFIPDSVLIAAGLATPPTATAEGHLAAIILQAKTALPQSEFEQDLDTSIYVTNGFSSFTARGTNNDSYRIDQIIINLAKIDTGATLDPDSY